MAFSLLLSGAQVPTIAVSGLSLVGPRSPQGTRFTSSIYQEGPRPLSGSNRISLSRFRCGVAHFFEQYVKSGQWSAHGLNSRPQPRQVAGTCPVL